MADRVALLRDGAVVQCDTPQRLYRSPATRFAADFVGEINFLPAQVAAVGDGRITLESSVGRFDKPLGEVAALPAAGPHHDSGAGGKAEASATERAAATAEAAPQGALVGRTLVVVGGTVTCALRPEALHISGVRAPDEGEAAAHRVRFAANVVESTYLGETAQHVLELEESDLRLRVLEANPTGPPPSRRVTGWFSTEDLMVLAD